MHIIKKILRSNIGRSKNKFYEKYQIIFRKNALIKFDFTKTLSYYFYINFIIKFYYKILFKFLLRKRKIIFLTK